MKGGFDLEIINVVIRSSKSIQSTESTEISSSGTNTRTLARGWRCLYGFRRYQNDWIS